MLLMITAIAFASTDANYSAALQTHFAKGTLGSPGKTRPIEMFFQNVFKSGNSYSVSGKSKTNAAEDTFSGTLTISGTAAGGSCASGETEIKGSYNLNEKESKTSGYFAGSFTACEKSGKLSKANFKGNWVKHATSSKTPCDFELVYSGSEISTFTDIRDGKEYKVVKIGKQAWMAENLNYEAEGSKCYDNKPTNCDKYGRLYDWKTAMKACPNGWHLPSREEWKSLDFGNSETAGKKLKAKSDWSKNVNGDDIYGFAALPGGNGSAGGRFLSVGYGGYWWSSSENEGFIAYSWNLRNNDNVHGADDDKDFLFSVRCVKD
jgi:uncharacterized protein (TIGR02145 family)